jgi:hypothetical protein
MTCPTDGWVYFRSRVKPLKYDPVLVVSGPVQDDEDNAAT